MEIKIEKKLSLSPLHE